MFLLIAFIVLLIAGLYTGEMSKKSACVYFLLFFASVGCVSYLGWHLAVWWLIIGLLDAIMVIHVFKGNIALRKM